jgi:hypothetical protein
MKKKANPVSDDQKESLSQYGYEVVDEVEIGEYDLVLTLFPLLGSYNLALQRQGMDFSDPGQQMTKTPATLGVNLTLAIPFIDDWIRKYGTLWVGGNNPHKMRVYEKILTRLGYTMEKGELFGYVMMGISSPSTRGRALKAKLLSKLPTR